MGGKDRCDDDDKNRKKLYPFQKRFNRSLASMTCQSINDVSKIRAKCIEAGGSDWSDCDYDTPAFWTAAFIFLVLQLAMYQVLCVTSFCCLRESVSKNCCTCCMKKRLPDEMLNAMHS